MASTTALRWCSADFHWVDEGYGLFRALISDRLGEKLRVASTGLKPECIALQSRGELCNVEAASTFVALERGDSWLGESNESSELFLGQLSGQASPFHAIAKELQLLWSRHRGDGPVIRRCRHDYKRVYIGSLLIPQSLAVEDFPRGR